ncbi:MAG: hypothetical protein DMF85_04850 [Acidobacteria bacterium]|nr:MAG: hypothetical protein DMF85_04850 [Acidobacteriota bacterium]
MWFASTVFLVAQNSAPTATPPSGDPLRSLGLPALAATAATPGLDVLAWRDDFDRLTASEYRDVRPGVNLALRGTRDAIEALFAISDAATPSSIVLGLAADASMTLDAEGRINATVGGAPVQIGAAFFQGRDRLTRVPGGLVAAGAQATMWAERTDPRQPLVVSLTIAFGTSSSGGPAVAWPALLTSTIQVDADADGQASPGDTLRYHLQISNATGSPLTNLVASLPVDSHTNAIVSSLNVSPIALDGTATTNEDTPAPITLVGSDADGNALTYTIVFPPAHGLLVPAAPGSPSLTYTPTADYSGPDTFTYVVHDGHVNSNETGRINVTIAAVNDAPSFSAGPDQIVAEDSGANTVPNWATGISAGPADESGQTLTFSVTGNTNPGLFAAGPAVATNGTLTYTPATNVFGSATITLRLQDNGGTASGGIDTVTHTFTITVTGVNHAPSFTAGANVTVLEDAGAQSVSGWATGISPGPNESFQTVTFNVTNNTNPSLFSTPPAVSPAGTLTFTPAANANGSATITLTLSHSSSR